MNYVIVTRFLIPAQSGVMDCIEDSFVRYITRENISIGVVRSMARIFLAEKYSEDNENFNHDFSVAYIATNSMEFIPSK